MKPSEKWIKDWRCDASSKLEKEVSEELVEIFKGFWVWADLDAKSKSTKQRYSAGLHALGGFLIEQLESEVNDPGSAHEFLARHIDAGEGPLIHHDNQEWQNEIDIACRKLYKYLSEHCSQGH